MTGGATAPKGLILVGGLGTQLRPLTLSKPKALIEFGNKPLLLHFIDALSRAGVQEVVLAINYRPQIMRDFLDTYQDAYGIKITCLQEDEPLGTAGPIALAHEQGLLDDEEPFFVINCDVACDFNLRDLYHFHKQHGMMGTIMVTRVDEPAKCAPHPARRRPLGPPTAAAAPARAAPRLHLAEPLPYPFPPFPPTGTASRWCRPTRRA